MALYQPAMGVGKDAAQRAKEALARFRRSGSNLTESNNDHLDAFMLALQTTQRPTEAMIRNILASKTLQVKQGVDFATEFKTVTKSCFFTFWAT